MIRRIGFTGTQRGMTEAQKSKVFNLLSKVGLFEAHHGDCIGADFDFHALCESIQDNTAIHIHPPLIQGKRAFCDQTIIKPIQVYPEKGYLERNQDIVDVSEWLIGTPKEYEEIIRSGTWATIRRGRRKIPVSVVFPNGTVSRQGIWPKSS